MRERPIGPPASGVVATEVEGDVAVYAPRSATAAMLNTTASDIWALADGTRTLAQITHELGERYGISPGEIEGDVAIAVEALEQQGFLAADE